MTVLLRVTSVVRLFDFRLASNQFVLAAAAVATLAAFAFGRDGVAAGLTVFLSWAARPRTRSRSCRRGHECGVR